MYLRNTDLLMLFTVYLLLFLNIHFPKKYNYLLISIQVPIIIVGLLNVISCLLTSFNEIMAYAVLYGFLTGSYWLVNIGLTINWQYLQYHTPTKSVTILQSYTNKKQYFPQLYNSNNVVTHCITSLHCYRFLLCCSAAFIGGNPQLRQIC